jgi:hypothetical protein
MPGGQVHELSNSHVKVRFTEDATFGVVLTSIENLDDGATANFEPQSPYRLRLRALGTTDSFVELGSAAAGSLTIAGVGHDSGAFHLGANHESPALGGRSFFEFEATHSVDGSDLRVVFTASLLDRQPDRVLFALYLDPSHGAGLGGHGIFWCAPILLALSPFASDHYLIGVNGGACTRNPRVDLVGNGSSYRFNVGRQPDIFLPQDELYPATGFAPETKAAQFADRMEVFYPSWASTAIAAYGDRGAGGTTIYLHDALHFQGRRMIDGFVGGRILLEHEGLVENGIAARNGWTIAGDSDLRRVETYVRVFRRVGGVLGEEVGLDYRRWALGSAEGKLIVPLKTKDRTDNGVAIRGTPFFRPYFPQDDEYETGITEKIAHEFRLAFPALQDEPLYRVNYDLLFHYGNDSSGTLPDHVGNTSPDLFGIAADAAKKDYAEELLEEYGLWTFGAAVPRRATPFDGRGLFDSEGMSAARVRNHLEALDAGYKTVDQWLRHSRTVTAVSLRAGFTKITLSGPAWDPSLFNLTSHYAGTTAGIDHAAHQFHLGWLRRADGSYAFPIEQQFPVDFVSAPPKVYVAGDRRLTILPGHTLDLFFCEPTYLPGYDAGTPNRVGDNAPTSLCAMADEAGRGVADPAAGWAVRYVAEFLASCRPWTHGVLHLLTKLQPVCFGSHGDEVPGGNQQLLGWRRILAYFRVQVGQPFQILEEDGPFDWNLGLVDGFTRSNVRNDLTTAVGSWGASPFFQTVWSEHQRFGGFLGENEGHLTNYGGAAFYSNVFEGAAKANYREALAGDFLLGRLPSIGIYPAADGAMGLRPDGEVAYTPFFHESSGMAVEGSSAQFCAKLVQFVLQFRGAQLFGRRLRSLERRGSATVDFHPLTVTTAWDNFHNIGPEEGGPQRPPLLHALWQDPANPLRLIALFVNDFTAGRSDLYEFHPAWYADALPPVAGTSGRVTRFEFGHAGAATQPLGSFAGDRSFPIVLDAGGVIALAFDFAPTAGGPIAPPPAP